MLLLELVVIGNFRI